MEIQQQTAVIFPDIQSLRLGPDMPADLIKVKKRTTTTTRTTTTVTITITGNIVPNSSTSGPMEVAELGVEVELLRQSDVHPDDDAAVGHGVRPTAMCLVRICDPAKFVELGQNWPHATLRDLLNRQAGDFYNSMNMMPTNAQRLAFTTGVAELGMNQTPLVSFPCWVKENGLFVVEIEIEIDQTVTFADPQ